MSALELRNVSKSFGEQRIYQNVSLALPSKGLILLLGESGSGKSTLFEMLSGIDVEYDGEICCFGRFFKEMSEKERSDFRLQNIGFLRQSFDLLPHESVLDNAMIPLEGEKLSAKEKRIRASALLNDVGLEKKAKALSFTLSGGEKQRLSFVRAIINDPAFLLCDEPTGALDPDNALSLLELLKRTSKRRLVLISSHDEALFNEVSDAIYSIENHKITCKKPFLPLLEKQSEVPLKSNKRSSSFLFWLKHAVHLFKAKKMRTALSVALLSFSFLSFGLSMFLSRDVSKKIETAFSSLTGEGTIVMSLRNGNQPSLSNVLSAPLSELRSLAKDYDGSIELCASYLSSFEQMFKDANDMSLRYGSRQYSFASMSARSINDYLLLSDYPSNAVFPSRPRVLEVDDIVLAFPQRTMRDLAKAFSTESNYQAVASFLLNHKLALELWTENEDWGYYDHQSFFIKGIMEFDTPTIFHSDPLWNEAIYEGRMRLPSSDGSSFSTPWTLHKAYGFRNIRDEEGFLTQTRGNRWRDFLFDKDSYRYDQSHNEVSLFRKDCRYFAFSANRFGLKQEDIDTIANSSRFLSLTPLAEGAYRAYPAAMAVGFREPFVLGKEEKIVTEYADSLSKVSKETMAILPVIPDGLAVGSYLRPRSSALTFSSDLSSLAEGVRPNGIDEIVLSRSLYERLGKPINVYVAGARETNLIEWTLYRDYGFAELKVVGVSSLENDVIVGDSYWLIDFFRARLGMSVFSLEPRECLLLLKERANAKESLSYLSSRYPSYSFVDPSSIISESVAQVVGYISTILAFASGVCLLSSLLLLLAVSLLHIVENKAEGRYLFCLGFSKERIFDSHFSGVFLLLSSAFGAAFFSLSFVEVFFEGAIRDSFGLSSSFQMDFLPHFFVFLVYLLSLLLAGVFIKSMLRKSGFGRDEAT